MTPAARGARPAPRRTRSARPHPVRTCVACREARAKRELTRIVRTPDGRVVVDAGGRIAGRGAYVCDSPACRTAAFARGGLARTLRTPVPDGLAEMLEAAAPARNETEGGARGTQ